MSTLKALPSLHAPRWLTTHLALVGTVALLTLGLIRLMTFARGDFITATALLSANSALLIGLDLIRVLIPYAILFMVGATVVFSKQPMRKTKIATAITLGIAVLVVVLPWVQGVGYAIAILGYLVVDHLGSRPHSRRRRLLRRLNQSSDDEIDRIREQLLKAVSEFEEASDPESGDPERVDELRVAIPELSAQLEDEFRRGFRANTILFAALVALVLMPLLASPPWPLEEIRINGEGTLQGYVVTTGEWWLILREGDRSVAYVPGDDVGARRLCAQKTPRPNLVTLVLGGQAPAYERCEPPE